MFYIRQILSGARFKYALPTEQPTTEAAIEGESPRFYERKRVGAKKLWRYVRALYVPDAGGATLAPLTKINVFEAPYGLLDSTKKAAITGLVGYVGVTASRDSTAAVSYAVYVSTTANSGYVKVADNRAFTPYADVIDALNIVHERVVVGNLMDMPNTLPADTVGMIYDTSGQQEFSLFNTPATKTVAGDTVRVFEGVQSGIWDSLPMAVGYADSAAIQLLTEYTLDSTLRTEGDVLYVKVVPKDAGGLELALTAIAPIAITITGCAFKPYPPRMFGYYAGGKALADLTVDDFSSFPSQQFFRSFHYIRSGVSNRLAESSPSSYFSPAATIEAGVTNVVERLDADGNVAATYNATTTGIQQITTDWRKGTETYRIYANRSGVRSVESLVTIDSQLRDIGEITALTGAQSGGVVNFTVTRNAENTTQPSAASYALTGTAVNNLSVDSVTVNNGCQLDEYRFVQVPAGVSSFVISVAVSTAVGETLTLQVGDLSNSTGFKTATVTIV